MTAPRILLASLALGAIALTTGCEQGPPGFLPEHWFVQDFAELPLAVEGRAHVDATVFTSPEAWPERMYSNALRVGMEGVELSFLGEVVDGELVVEPDRELNIYSFDGVGVLDAWRDCTPDEACERTFRFEVVCPEGPGGSEGEECVCEGVFDGDAFISTKGLKPERDRGGFLELHFERVDPR